MIAVDFITNIAPHYREHLWLELMRLEKYRFRFFFGEEPSSSIRQIEFGNNPWRAHIDRVFRLTNFRFKHALVWQCGVISRAVTSDAKAAIILGDMHVLSNWLAAALFRLRRRKVVFWGHGLTGNESRAKLVFRMLFLRLAHRNLVYGERAKRLLVEKGIPEARVSVIFNSLDYGQQKTLRNFSIDTSFYKKAGLFQNPDLPVLIFVGRLTRQKKLNILIDAVAALNESRQRFNLIFVGDGPERQELESLAAACSGHIHFYGPCYEEKSLAKLIANADLCVSPGEIGLTAIHSLSFGTPACTHSDFRRQMPEVEAIVEGSTGTFFDETSNDLSHCIERWFHEKPDREKIRLACYRVIDEKYNPEVQIEVLKNTLATLGLEQNGAPGN